MTAGQAEVLIKVLRAISTTLLIQLCVITSGISLWLVVR